jgi:beta-lactamase superfamily II metal-dependent hydrolase
VPTRKFSRNRKKKPAAAVGQRVQKRKNAPPTAARTKGNYPPEQDSLIPAPGNNATAETSGAVPGLRVRMYRVGFGDFFLLSVPSATGPKHILIDCGVHAGDIGSIKDAVSDMAKETGGRLALLIVTHRHADHISGFATCKDVFSKFNVERIWMSWFENPNNKNASRFQANLTAVAMQLTSALAARNDPDSQELKYMAENITGPSLGFGTSSGNAVALSVLHGSFNGKQPPIDYYKAGDSAKLPQELIDAGLAAQILGPPIDPTLVSQMSDKNEQYLAGSDHSNLTSLKPPFKEGFETDANHYPHTAFERYSSDKIQKSVNDAQPDLLAAKARQADNTLNNQSLVVLFTIAGKTLLFVGDAQWGNWENFLFGGKVGTDGHATLTDQSKKILGNVDFYKVGHHGSANATPIAAVEALRNGCAAMCSTQPGYYGKTSSGTEVPRAPLLAELDKRTNHQLARSDEIPVDGWPPTQGLGPVPSVFQVPTKQLFIDYNF